MRLIVCFAALAASGLAQPAAGPAFEVASIKVSTEPPGSSSWNTHPGSLQMRNLTLKRLIMAAYNLKEIQVAGGPKWLDDDRYNIDAKADGPAKDEQLMAMLQTLLTERFQLTFRHETRPFPGYALVVAKGGLKIKPDPSVGGGTTNTRRDSMVVERRSMDNLAVALSRLMGAQVSDETNVTGKFTFNLKWTPDEAQPMPTAAGGEPAAAPSATAGPSLPAVLQDQLGLKLEARRIPVAVLVVDRAEKPSEN